MELLRFTQGLLDFHNHSTYSDGRDTPKQLVERAVRHGVSAMALTDHHNESGLPEFREACREYGILAIPFGVEICAELPHQVLEEGDNEAPDLVILGKNAREDPMVDYKKRYMRETRDRILPEALRRLEKVGFEMPEVDLDAECRGFHCPPDIMHKFVDHADNMNVLISYVRAMDSSISPEDVREKPIMFVNRFLYGIDCPAYVKRREGFDVDDAIDLADAMNCTLFIAHPGGGFGFLSDRILDYYIQKRINIEVRNYFNSPEQNAKFDRLANKHNLLRSGGSDYHGEKGPFKIGMYDRQWNQLPKDILEELWCGLPS